MNESEIDTCINILRNGGIAVIPTDTVYGMVCSALNKEAEGRLYAIKNRSFDKPCIILIRAIKDIELFGITLREETKTVLSKLWPNPVSVILPCNDEAFQYLHRGKCSLAFRIPKSEFLLNFLKQTGPLLAPSANPEGKPPALTITNARSYFGDRVDYYLGNETLTGKPSTLISLSEEGTIKVLRTGAVNTDTLKLK